MSTRPASFAPLLLAVLSTSAACTASTAVIAQEEVMILEVAPQTAPCVGEMAGSCLQVRAPDEEAWRLFYDPIEGFQHEEGVRYTLEVSRRTVVDPPADGSAYAYRLIRIIDREPPAG